MREKKNCPKWNRNINMFVELPAPTISKGVKNSVFPTKANFKSARKNFLHLQCTKFSRNIDRALQNTKKIDN